jgi:hypothetical protein
MAFYAFVHEPPVPRTQFETEPKKTEEVRAVDPEAPMSDFDQALTNVLIRFPDAYHAVVDEMRRLRATRKGSP